MGRSWRRMSLDDHFDVVALESKEVTGMGFGCNLKIQWWIRYSEDTVSSSICSEEARNAVGRLYKTDNHKKFRRSA